MWTVLTNSCMNDPDIRDAITTAHELPDANPCIGELTRTRNLVDFSCECLSLKSFFVSSHRSVKCMETAALRHETAYLYTESSKG